MRRLAGLRFAAAALAPLLSSVAPAQEVLLPTPVTTIYPGQVIAADQIVLRSFTDLAGEAAAMARAADQLVGRAARRTLVAGRPIPAIAVGDAHAVRAGATVAIVYRSGPFIIRALGQALQSAAAGAPVKVRNTETGRVIDAVAQADGSVTVGE